MPASGDVLFLDSAHPLLSSDLEGLGYNCIHDPEITHEKLLDLMPGLTGIIVRSKFFLGENELQRAEKLRFIGRVGSGLENIDVAYAGRRGIACLNSPEGNCDAVGEHATGLLLSLVNHICKAHHEVCSASWKREENRGTELRGKTMAIIGYGHTGSAFARCLGGFGMDIVAYDKYKTGYGSEWVEESNMEEIYRRADFLSLHVPLTAETRYLADFDYLNSFRKNIFLINTSRGPVVNTADLCRALRSGKVRGAALDVLEYEHLSFEDLDLWDLPEPFRFLASHPRVVLTPHVAGWTHESHLKLSRVLVDKIKNLDE